MTRVIEPFPNTFFNNFSSHIGILSMESGWELLRDIRELSGSYSIITMIAKIVEYNLEDKSP